MAARPAGDPTNLQNAGTSGLARLLKVIHVNPGKVPWSVAIAPLVIFVNRVWALLLAMRVIHSATVRMGNGVVFFDCVVLVVSTHQSMRNWRELTARNL
jgi:hypothetical protein